MLRLRPTIWSPEFLTLKKSGFIVSSLARGESISLARRRLLRYRKAVEISESGLAQEDKTEKREIPLRQYRRHTAEWSHTNEKFIHHVHY